LLKQGLDDITVIDKDWRAARISRQDYGVKSLRLDIFEADKFFLGRI